MLSVANHSCSSPSLRAELLMWFDDPSWLLARQVLDGVGGGPRSEPDCMSWSFPRQINLPPIRSPARSDATGSIAQLAVATAARTRFCDGLLLLTSSPGQAYSQPPYGVPVLGG